MLLKGETLLEEKAQSTGSSGSGDGDAARRRRQRLTEAETCYKVRRAPLISLPLLSLPLPPRALSPTCYKVRRAGARTPVLPILL